MSCGLSHVRVLEGNGALHREKEADNVEDPCYQIVERQEADLHKTKKQAFDLPGDKSTSDFTIETGTRLKGDREYRYEVRSCNDQRWSHRWWRVNINTFTFRLMSRGIR